MSFFDLAARGHEIAAQECDAIATYLDRLAEAFPGQTAGDFRIAAYQVRERAGKHPGEG